tara:strand:+ start:55 stop:549 length:495 start_codon:yes stop_codon:yes gene_type:complete
MTDRDKEKLIETINRLNNTSKIDLYYFMKKMEIPHTENVNGQFFLISELSDTDYNMIQTHVNDLVEFDTRMKFNSSEYSDDSGEQKQEQPSSSVMNTISSNKPFDVKEDILEFFEKQNNISKRTISTKYYISLKKYNKVNIQEAVKTEGDTDLNELVEEEYILR